MIGVLLMAFIIMAYGTAFEMTNKSRETLDAVEKNLTKSLDEILLDDAKHMTYGRMREALHILHGLTDILLWEKKADGTKVPRDSNSMMIQCK